MARAVRVVVLEVVAEVGVRGVVKPVMKPFRVYLNRPYSIDIIVNTIHRSIINNSSIYTTNINKGIHSTISIMREET